MGAVPLVVLLFLPRRLMHCATTYCGLRMKGTCMIAKKKKKKRGKQKQEAAPGGTRQTRRVGPIVDIVAAAT